MNFKITVEINGKSKVELTQNLNRVRDVQDAIQKLYWNVESCNFDIQTITTAEYAKLDAELS